VCIPGLGRDQGAIAQRVAELGLGIALTPDAGADEIQAAVRSVLDDRAYRQAHAFERRCGNSGGAGAAADVIARMALSR
jgi:UDP:flavonoid glycosyltransferase YjiC (YdhE family)